MATKCRMIELYDAGKALKTDDSASRPDLTPITVDDLSYEIKSGRLVIVASKSGTERTYVYRGSFLVTE